MGGTGTFTMNGGAFYNNSQLVLGEDSGAVLGSGTFNLNGGLMQASAVRPYQNDATSVLNFGGGVLQVSDNAGNNDYNSYGPVWLHSHYIATTTTATVTGANSAKIDTNGYTIGIDQTLKSSVAATGGLTKQGAGSLYLATTPTYNGVTTVNNGSLVLDRSNLPGAVKVSAGGTLRLSNPSGLTGTYYNTGVGDLGVYNSLSTLNTYLATLTPDATTHNSKEAGSFLDMGVNGQYFPAAYNNGSQNFQVVWTGTFHATTAGVYNFATASDDGSMLFLDGNAVVNNNNWQGTTRHTGSVTLAANQDYPITIAYYQGGGGYGMWTEVQQPGQQWQYLANDMVSSTDPLTAQAFSIGSLGGTGGTVDLGGALNKLTVNQTADDTFAGVITGSGSLVKNGPSKLTLTQDIAYTGDTVVNSGILVAQNMKTSAHISVLGSAELYATSIVTDTLTIGGTPAAAAAVPEPGTLVLLALAGLALAGAYLRRR
jgi:autotransporter-associated beta strand protein